MHRFLILAIILSLTALGAVALVINASEAAAEPIETPSLRTDLARDGSSAPSPHRADVNRHGKTSVVKSALAESEDREATILAEDFEGPGWPPADWTVIQTSTGYYGDDPCWWSHSSTRVHSGDSATGLWFDMDNHQDEWLISPAILLTGSPDDLYSLSFWTYGWQGSTYDDHYYVKVSTNDGASWTPLWDLSELPYTGSFNGWEYPYEIDLSAYANQTIKLAWHAIDCDDPGNPNYPGLWFIWFIDDVVISASGPGFLTSPSQNELDVPQETDVDATFILELDGGTVHNSSFVVQGSFSGLSPGVISYDAPSGTATLNPTTGFFPGELVTVALTSGIGYSTGESLIPYVWSFTTETNGGSGVLVHDADYTVAQYPRGICAGDLDNDGDIDVVTAAMGGWLGVQLNNGDGTFAVYSSYPAMLSPTSVRAADFDGDGYLDLVSNGFSWDAAIWLNDGDGTFGTPVTYRGATGNVQDLVAADFDGDGDIDIAGTHVDSVAVWRNNGDGTFGSCVLYEVGNLPSDIRAADFNNDGNIDLAVGHFYSASIIILTNYGSGNFGIYPPDTLFCHDNVNYVLAADLDEDGSVDLVSVEPGIDSIFVHFNNGDGSFAAGVGHEVGGYCLWADAGDFDSDGDLDLVLVDSYDQILVLLNDGSGTFAPPVTYATTNDPETVVAFDCDGDLDLDLAVAGDSPYSVSIFRNENDWTCGDANGNGSVNVGDVVYLINWIATPGSPSPVYPFAGDADECGTANVADALYIVDYVFVPGSPAPCEGSVDCDLPGGANSIDLGVPITAEPGEQIQLPIYVTTDVDTRAMTIGLSYPVAALDFVSVDFTGGIADQYDADYSLGNEMSPGQIVILTFWFPPDPVPPQSGALLANVVFDVIGSGPQNVDIDSLTIGGAEIIFCPPGGGAIPPAYNDNGTADIMIRGPYICGDADGNGIVEISDAVHLISYVFVPGSPAPDPLAAGDADCNTIVEISDAVLLISYVFVPGSPEPCDPDGDGVPDC